jgi:hypothetical protein
MKMSIRTMCEVCKKVVRYTDDNQQVQEAVDNPEQFCEGHIAEPTKEAQKSIMAILRANKNPDNCFFISKEDGRLMSHAHINKAQGEFFPSIPKGSYELNAGKKRSRSYAILGEHLHEAWVWAARIETGGF